MDEAILSFIEKNQSAAMTTLRRDGTPHTVRVGVAVIDGKIWSSGTANRIRTRHLRRDPRSTLFVFDSGFAFLTLECRVNLLEGSDAPQQNFKLFQIMQRDSPAPAGKVSWFGVEKSIDEFLKVMVDEKRLIYEFEVQRSYGAYGATA